MKLSELKVRIDEVIVEFGDLEANVLDGESGVFFPVLEVRRLENQWGDEIAFFNQSKW